MTLHDAIAEILQEHGGSLHRSEVVNELARRGHTKQNGQPIDRHQISARVSKYPELLTQRDGLIYLADKQRLPLQEEISMTNRTIVFNYFLAQHYQNDLEQMSNDTGYTIAQLESWRDGVTTPQHQTIEYICNCLFTPEFTIVCEFSKLDPDEYLKTQLRDMLGEHHDLSGLYAFYDSMAELLYVGKATNLLDEIYSALRREAEIVFPAGIKNKSVQRHQVTRYVSAYAIKQFPSFDYPKHVESIILRISKPRLNTQIGYLAEAYPKEGGETG